jgi:hypothetical protein
MISLGAISRNLTFRAGAAAVLAEHATYTWNKAGTRIRCNGDSCGVILEALDGPEGITAVTVFARHQAEQLPDPEPESPPEPETAAPAEAAAPAIETGHEDTPAEPEPTPEPEPAGDTMEQTLSDAALACADAREAETVQAAPKVRRDTKALTATISEINKGDRVRARFNHPRYGQFTVEGTVVKGGAGLDRNQLIVGGWYINLNERAAKYLHELDIIAPAGKHEFAIPKPSELTEHVGIGG